jgi:hypothetical protein
MAKRWRSAGLRAPAPAAAAAATDASRSGAAALLRSVSPAGSIGFYGDLFFFGSLDSLFKRFLGTTLL